MVRRGHAPGEERIPTRPEAGGYQLSAERLREEAGRDKEHPAHEPIADGVDHDGETFDRADAEEGRVAGLGEHDLIRGLETFGGEQGVAGVPRASSSPAVRNVSPFRGEMPALDRSPAGSQVSSEALSTRASTGVVSSDSSRGLRATTATLSADTPEG